MCGDAFFQCEICRGREAADDLAFFFAEFAPGAQAAFAATRAVILMLKAHGQSCVFAFNLNRAVRVCI
jgi:hypothetical protein